MESFQEYVFSTNLSVILMELLRIAETNSLLFCLVFLFWNHEMGKGWMLLSLEFFDILFNLLMNLSVILSEKVNKSFLDWCLLFVLKGRVIWKPGLFCYLFVYTKLETNRLNRKGILEKNRDKAYWKKLETIFILSVPVGLNNTNNFC